MPSLMETSVPTMNKAQTATDTTAPILEQGSQEISRQQQNEQIVARIIQHDLRNILFAPINDSTAIILKQLELVLKQLGLELSKDLNIDKLKAELNHDSNIDNNQTKNDIETGQESLTFKLLKELQQRINSLQDQKQLVLFQESQQEIGTEQSQEQNQQQLDLLELLIQLKSALKFFNNSFSNTNLTLYELKNICSYFINSILLLKESMLSLEIKIPENKWSRFMTYIDTLVTRYKSTIEKLFEKRPIIKDFYMKDLLTHLENVYSTTSNLQGRHVKIHADYFSIGNVDIHMLISTVMYNLIDNALKYSENGSVITVNIRHVKPTSLNELEEWIIEVKNIGPIIKPHELDTIFMSGVEQKMQQ